MTSTNIAESLNRLLQRGVQLWADAATDQLRFRAPKGALAEEHRDWLAAHKAEVLAHLRSETEFPLTFGQERLWFLDQLEPGSAFYNMPLSYRLRGPLNPEALEKSFNEVINRHAVLRTTFSMQQERPVQSISPSLFVPLSRVDLRHVPVGSREDKAEQLLEKGANEPFDLAAGPLIRTTLYQLDEQDYLLFLNLHHIVADGWSLRNVLHQELASLYDGFCRGETPALPPPPIQFADFARWQRQATSNDHLAEQVAYWRKQLDGYPSMLQLPTDHSRPMSQTFRGSMEYFTLPAPLGDRLRDLSRQQNVTLASTFQAAFNLLLHRYTGQDDILIGFPIASRSQPELEKVIGFITNTLVLRTDLSGNPSFSELLSNVHQTALEAYAHQDVPFAKLVEELQPDRYLNQTPFFQVMFGMSSSSDSLALAGIETASMCIHYSNTAKFDLSLLVAESGQEVRLRLEYNLDLFERETIKRLIGHFLTLLEGIVANPDVPIWTLPMQSDGERQQLSAWNRTLVDFPRDKCIHELVETQAERTPGEIAVQFTDESGQRSQLTYGELDCRANQLAHHLQKLGVGPDVLVGICLDRSMDMVVGLLATLKAGGASVALDPTHPQEHLRFMIEDARMAALITQESLRSMIPTGLDLSLVSMDTIWQDLADERTDKPSSTVSGENLIYAIYTSGSTGMPKGIGFPHQAFLNMLQWQQHHPILSNKMRTLQYSTFGFCVSFQEIFYTWLMGGTLVLLPDATRRDMNRLARLLVEEEIEALYLPFTALKHLAEVYGRDSGGNGAIPLPTTLRAVVTAGEPLRLTDSIREWFTQLKDCSLHNQYGASETHVVSAFTVTGPTESWPAIAPIGTPIANTQIHIVDRNNQPVPVGVPGELCVGGIALAKGYLNDPELTRQKFVPDPFAVANGDRTELNPGSTPAMTDPPRLYKTGDLARYLSDGNIEHLGRIDQQAKIRGFRLELEAVEAVIRQFPSIRDTVVLVHENTEGVKRLVAYLVASGDDEHVGSSSADQSVVYSTLRRYLKTKLPDYMVPAIYLRLNSLPVNANGKLDQQALLSLVEQDRPELEMAFVEPRSDTEAALAEIWAEVLELERVGVYDNFFDLGGHSLLATQILSRMLATFDIELPLRVLFESPTVADLTVAMTQFAAEQVDEDVLAQLLDQCEST